MMADNPAQKRTNPDFLVPLIALLTFFILYILRDIDDNRLTSWKWVFADADITGLLIIFVPVMIAAYAISKIAYTERIPAIFLFVSSFAACALFWNEPEVIVDASRYFTQAKHLEIYGVRYFIDEWGWDIVAWTDLPLVPLIYGLIFKVLGETRQFIQLFNGLLYSMTVLLTYLTGRVLWDKGTGFCAGALMMGIPYVFSQTPLMLVDIPTMFFLSFSVYSFIRAMEKGGAWTAVASIAVVCALLSKYSTWIMLSVLPVIFFVYSVKGRRTWDLRHSDLKNVHRPSRGGAVVRLTVIGLISGLCIGLIVLFKFDIISAQISFLRAYQAPGLRRWGESFVSTFFFQVHPFITLAALYSVYEAFRRKDPKFLIISWMILLIVLLQIKRSRYVMVAFPMLTLMASYGLQRIGSAETRRAVVFCAVAASIAAAFWGYLPLLKTMSMTNLKDAGAYINSLDADRVEVFAVRSEKSIVNQAIAVPILDLYTDKEILYNHDADFTPPYEKIEKSPLRFTWEYRNPDYYRPAETHTDRAGVIVVISNKSDETLPDFISEKTGGLSKGGSFNTSTGIFRYSPVVTIYGP